MTPKEKAYDLVFMFKPFVLAYAKGADHYDIECALLHVDGILEEYETTISKYGEMDNWDYDTFVKYWSDVKVELKKLKE